MSTTALIVLAVIVVAIILVVVWVGVRRRRLRSRFGPEYERVARESGSKWRADSELAARQQRREKLNIRPLPSELRDRYSQAWQQVQADFVDQPYEAVANADTLVGEVMQQRGYPMDNFDQHANDLSVDYPQLVDNYRGAHAIATRKKSANTEDLRKAMLHYRNLFQELLGKDGPAPATPARPADSTATGDGADQEAPAEQAPVARERQR